MQQLAEELCAECRNRIANNLNENKGTMLHFTVRSKHDKCMEVLLEAGADVNWCDESTFTSLIRAAEYGYVYGVQRLIQAGADVNRRVEDNKTALMLAGSEGHDKCVELLLNAGADVNVWTNGEYDKQFTALHASVNSRNMKTGADVNRKSKKNETALKDARFEGPVKCIEMLLDAGADVNAVTCGPCEQFTALHFAMSYKNISCVEMLLRAGADVNKEGYQSPFEDDGVTALCLAAGDGFDEAVKLLIEAGADVNKVPKNGTTPLMEVIQHYEGDASKRTKCIELLIEAGADINIECLDDTPLYLALEHSFHEAVNLLIRAGVDVNEVRKNGITPLIATSLVCDQPVNNVLKCLELLIQAGADVNMTTPEGSALTAASKNGFDEGVQLLIQSGADVNELCLGLDETPLMISTVKGFLKTADLLLQAGADVNLANSDGTTALMVVSLGRVFYEREMNRFSSSKFLLRSGAKINTRNSQSENALVCIVSTFNGSGRGIYQLAFALGKLNFGKRESDICLLLFAAGETLDGIPDEKIPNCLKFDDVKLELKHICRETIRKHLLCLDPHTHLFGRVPRLGLPSLLTEYLLYNQTLDDDD